jgi:osmotically-inducible protein OsmY
MKQPLRTPVKARRSLLDGEEKCARREAMVKTDNELQRDVFDEIHWEPRIDAAKVDVVVKDGIVKLIGFVKTCSERWEAEQAAFRVAEVRGLSNLISVGPEASPEDLNEKIGKALERNARTHAHCITVKTDQGKVGLYGVVRSWAERKEAGRG